MYIHLCTLWLIPDIISPHFLQMSLGGEESKSPFIGIPRHIPKIFWATSHATESRQILRKMPWSMDMTQLFHIISRLSSKKNGSLMKINEDHHLEKMEYSLVVYLPLRKMMEFVSWDDEIPNWMESHNPFMFQTTNPICHNPSEKYQWEGWHPIYIHIWNGKSNSCSKLPVPMIFYHILWKIKFMFQTTNQIQSEYLELRKLTGSPGTSSSPLDRLNNATQLSSTRPRLSTPWRGMASETPGRWQEAALQRCCREVL